MKTEHPYAHILRAIADGETEFEKFMYPGWYPLSLPNVLIALSASSSESISATYRIKPRTININGFKVPEPMRVVPEKDTRYWVANVAHLDLTVYVWDDDVPDSRWIKDGLCHLTKEAAELHRKALLSFTKAKDA